MERNYAGQYGGGYAGNGVSSPSQLVSSGRRAGTVRAQSAEEYPPSSSGSYGADPSAGAQQARYGRRASPAAYPSGSGMDMDPPRYTPSSMTAGHGGGYGGGNAGYGSGSGGGGYSSSASAGGQPMARPSRTSAPSGGAAAAAAPAGAGGSIANKLAGLQRLKENAASRLVNRIPSANSRNPSSGSSASSGYVPSAMTNQQPARQLPRTNSSGHGGAGSAGGYGYGSAGAAPGRSASVGRPPSGRSAGSAGPAAASSGYGRPPAAAAPSSYGNSGGYSGSGGGGGYSSSSSQPAAASGGARPSALSSLAQRRQPPAPAAPPPAAAEPPPAVRPRPGRAAAPAPSAPPPQSFGGGGGGFGGGGGGFGGGGGGGFMGGSVPPGADDPGASGPMVECPTCGRSFNEKAYQKHGKVCAKVFAQKRKPVNMAAKRLEGIPEAGKFFDLKKGVPKSEAKPAAAPAGRGGHNNIDNRPVPAQKLPKWKQQSAQLRAAMAANRQIVDAKAQGKDIRSLPVAPSLPDDRIPCPHCGRKFAELAAERHIPRCKDIMAKPGRLQAGAGRGAHMRR